MAVVLKVMREKAQGCIVFMLLGIYSRQVVVVSILTAVFAIFTSLCFVRSGATRKIGLRLIFVHFTSSF